MGVQAVAIPDLSIETVFAAAAVILVAFLTIALVGIVVLTVDDLRSRPRCVICNGRVERKDIAIAGEAVAHRECLGNRIVITPEQAEMIRQRNPTDSYRSAVPPEQRLRVIDDRQGSEPPPRGH